MDDIQKTYYLSYRTLGRGGSGFGVQEKGFRVSIFFFIMRRLPVDLADAWGAEEGPSGSL